MWSFYGYSDKVKNSSYGAFMDTIKLSCGWSFYGYSLINPSMSTKAPSIHDSQRERVTMSLFGYNMDVLVGGHGVWAKKAVDGWSFCGYSGGEKNGAKI